MLLHQLQIGKNWVCNLRNNPSIIICFSGLNEQIYIECVKFCEGLLEGGSNEVVPGRLALAEAFADPKEPLLPSLLLSLSHPHLSTAYASQVLSFFNKLFLLGKTGEGVNIATSHPAGAETGFIFKAQAIPN